MKNKQNLVWYIIIPVLIAIVIYSFQGGPTTEDYINEIEEKRKEQQDFLKTSEESPFLNEENNNTFNSLRYFPPDPAFKVNARLIPSDTKEEMTLATSTGGEDVYIKYGHAEFSLGGQKHRLLLLQPTTGEASDQLFLLFTDETSGRETYGAGRYMDIDMPDSRQLILDFNLVYNPYCAYNYDFSCPIPPPENNLPIAIRAGEKTYEIADSR